MFEEFKTSTHKFLTVKDVQLQWTIQKITLACKPLHINHPASVLHAIYYPVIHCHTLFTTCTSSIFTTWPYQLSKLSSTLSSMFFFKLNKFHTNLLLTQSIFLTPQACLQKFIPTALKLDLSYSYHISVSLTK